MSEFQLCDVRFFAGWLMLLNLVIGSSRGFHLWSLHVVSHSEEFPSADSAASRFFFMTLFMLVVLFMNLVVLNSYRGVVVNSFCIGTCPNWWNI